MATPVHISDVFTEDEPIIVDGDLIEAAKENIQPLARGRRATTLAAALSTPHAQREAKLASTRNRLRINVEVALEDEDDDPLAAYCEFIYWTVENYPEGHSAESGLLELLEEATRVLKDDRDGAWRGDIRYLKLWVLYASFVEKPTVIYRFLLANDIGVNHALLYEEFAAVLERAGRKQAADETYLLGINRRAEPAERLTTKHREFQKRMMLAATAPARPPSPPRAIATAGARKVLGESSTAKTTKRTPAVASSGSNAIASSSTAPRPNARVQIFVDPSGDEAAAAAEDGRTPWDELGGRKTRVKENVPGVAKMGGTKLKQRTVSGGGSKIPVFRDSTPEAAPPAKPPAKGGFAPFRDEPEVPATPSSKFTPFRDEPTTPSSRAAQAPDSVMKAKPTKSLSSHGDALRKDPFMNYGDKRPADVE
ncbi:unnamed protein product [Peniophora sp. CBMAI 1063]|nr:unnamed protein product [Peniophora sp. CBMAI 1063]